MEKTVDFERTIKELSQFDNKKPEELESEFDHFDAANSYPTSPFKGCNIVDLDFMYKQLLDGHKPCNTTLSLTQYQRERLISLRAWLNGNAMFYKTFICFYISESKPLCFSLCSQMFDDVE